MGICQNISKTESERLKKRIVKMFKDCGLLITIERNLKSVDFLDITFDLINNTYKPYWKPNNEPQYINKQSNHPPSTIKKLQKSIEKRLSENSSNVDVVNESAQTYNNALRKSNFTEKLIYETPTPKNNYGENKKRKRKRNILRFNPPYSKMSRQVLEKLF